MLKPIIDSPSYYHRPYFGKHPNALPFVRCDQCNEPLETGRCKPEKCTLS